MLWISPNVARLQTAWRSTHTSNYTTQGNIQHQQGTSTFSPYFHGSFSEENVPMCKSEVREAVHIQPSSRGPRIYSLSIEPSISSCLSIYRYISWVCLSVLNLPVYLCKDMYIYGMSSYMYTYRTSRPLLSLSTQVHDLHTPEIQCHQFSSGGIYLSICPLDLSIYTRIRRWIPRYWGR